MNNENFEYEQNQNPESSADKAYVGAEASEDSKNDFFEQEARYADASEPNAEAAFEDLSETVASVAKPKTIAFSILSLIFGIFSLVICCCSGWIAVIFGLSAIVLSLISRRHLGYFDGMSVAGLVLGISGTVFGLVTIVLSVLVELSLLSLFPEDFFHGLEDGMGSDFPSDSF